MSQAAIDTTRAHGGRRAGAGRPKKAQTELVAPSGVAWSFIRRAERAGLRHAALTWLELAAPCEPSEAALEVAAAERGGLAQIRALAAACILRRWERRYSPEAASELVLGRLGDLGAFAEQIRQALLLEAEGLGIAPFLPAPRRESVLIPRGASAGAERFLHLFADSDDAPILFGHNGPPLDEGDTAVVYVRDACVGEFLEQLAIDDDETLFAENPVVVALNEDQVRAVQNSIRPNDAVLLADDAPEPVRVDVEEAAAAHLHVRSLAAVGDADDI
jgi:hypothetical protein